MPTTTPRTIQQKNLPTTLTDLYTFTAIPGALVSAILASIDFANTTTSDVTIDLVKTSGGVDYYLSPQINVPAKAVASWRGLCSLTTTGDKIRALCSVATSVDVNGTVMESSV